MNYNFFVVIRTIIFSCLQVVEPPVEYLQEDITRFDERVPPDAFYMLQSIR